MSPWKAKPAAGQYCQSHVNVQTFITLSHPLQGGGAFFSVAR